MEEEIKESKDCRHYPRADGSWIYQEKGKPHPDYVVNVYQKLPSGIVSCSYNRLVKVLEGIEGQL